MKQSTDKKGLLAAKYLLLILFTIICLYPIVWLILNSFKSDGELFQNPWGLPAQMEISNYVYALKAGKIAQYFINSTIVSTVSVFFGVLLSCMISYAITRMKWKLSKLTLNVFLLGMMIPVYATIIPLFSIFNRLRLLNTLYSVIIPHIAFSFPIAVFILTGFFSTIPRDIEEAAVMDGCGLLRIFFQIICPISVSSIVTVAVITFLDVWNDLLLPQIFLTDSRKMTLPVGLTAFQGQHSVNYVAQIAAVVITVIPSIIVYVLLHKNIMEGMVAGAVKG